MFLRSAHAFFGVLGAAQRILGKLTFSISLTAPWHGSHVLGDTSTCLEVFTGKGRNGYIYHPMSKSRL